MLMIIVKKKKKCLVVSLPNTSFFYSELENNHAKLMIASVFPGISCSGTKALIMPTLL